MGYAEEIIKKHFGLDAGCDLDVVRAVQMDISEFVQLPLDSFPSVTISDLRKSFGEGGDLNV